MTKLSAEDRNALESTSRFHEMHSTSDLPPAVLALCSAGNGKMADPDQKWNATDAIIDPSLPGKRLIWAATGGEYYIVHYERGGIAHTFHILVVQLTNGETQSKVVWRAVGGPFTDYTAFVQALRAGKLDDRLSNSKFW
ncbi:MAG TPA: hypothetical protein VFQ78_08110 [Candidatus Udaeobacter sp.]|nr:hypothetical protein [Candidatus Udaeobacter sp.]